MDFHVPVMVREVVQGLVADPGGVYLDVTVGGGGHSRAILQALSPSGRLIAVDRDGEAVEVARRMFGENPRQVEFLRGSFVELKQLLKQCQVEAAHGILFDLGVSSHQIDEPSRGFSYREEGPLDMRMDPREGASAAELIELSTETELARLIKQYGEEAQARRIARSIRRLSQRRSLETTSDLRRAVEATHPRHLSKTLARVFQAFRIAVNDELGQLEKGLEATIDILTPGGRLAVLAYHSLEDRLVKTRLAELIRGCICPPELPVCGCGRKPRFRSVLRKPQRAGEEEVGTNPRARSAMLRVYEKL
jgi:16S rRNA (cytosine1402-N4)-methyltransferase